VTKPPADSLPGGAPIKKRPSSKRPCKYGPRDADGYCPKKPKASSSKATTTARKKPPCKYGPRDADGYCPKKQTKSARQAENIVKAVTGTPAKKAEARKSIAKDAKAAAKKSAEIAVQKPIERAIRPAARKKAAAKVKEWAGAAATGAASLAKKALPLASLIGLAVAGGAIMSAAMTDRYKKRAYKMLQDTIARTPEAQRYQYTAEVQATLLRQYMDYLRQQDATLFTK